MTKLFISHSTADDSFVRELRIALYCYGQLGWIDSRELRGGDPLWSEIERAITDASSFAVVVSPDSLESDPVGRELRFALDLQRERGREQFPVIPLLLDGTGLGKFLEFFNEEPVYIRLNSGAGGIEAAINDILVALRKRLPANVLPARQITAQPIEELVLELKDLKFDRSEDNPLASASARLIYQPADSTKETVYSQHSWNLIAPISPVEADELRWYLEKYPLWPSKHFRNRAQEVEANLAIWGRRLHDAALPPQYTQNVMLAWAIIDAHAERRFSILVDATQDAASPESEVNSAKEAAAVLLGLPWELLHDGGRFLFQGAKPVRVRRRLPSTNNLPVAMIDAPIRILLVTPRPEDPACTYIDHRASAIPLVDAMESLPGLVEIKILNPPTLSVLSDELEHAQRLRRPYHVVHFDGHGVYNRDIGLGGLCFERNEDNAKLIDRGHDVVYSNQLGPLLHAYGIPLVFLEACQTAQAEKASESVASELLNVGVVSVVAMSHSVLVETVRRFVQAFYAALSRGERIGDAMLAGQRQLKNDTFRASIFGAGDLKLEDWFVPVLFQQRDDPGLFNVTPSKQTQQDYRQVVNCRIGDLPPTPETGFIGRSRELLALQRLFSNGQDAQYAVIVGQGGEGKTAIAAEFARWMVRSQQMRRVAFVCAEGLEVNIVQYVIDTIGRQLVGKKFSTSIDFDGDLHAACRSIQRELREQPTLLILDNMESILLPPYLAEQTADVVQEEARHELGQVFELATRLLRAGETRIIFTSRETLPKPFSQDSQRITIWKLDRDDAIQLIERMLDFAQSPPGNTGVSTYEEIESLVDAVHCHVRTLTLLGPYIQEHGVRATRESLANLMIDMEHRFPGSREQSVFASVELSLRRMPTIYRDSARVLGVFHGAANTQVLQRMLHGATVSARGLIDELVRVGLATQNQHGQAVFDPALCPYLRLQLGTEFEKKLLGRWIETMVDYTKDLAQLVHKQSIAVSRIINAEFENFFALIDNIAGLNRPEDVVVVAGDLRDLSRSLNLPRWTQTLDDLISRAMRDVPDGWNHIRFKAERRKIESLCTEGGDMRVALSEAKGLLARAKEAGSSAYRDAKYDIAGAHYTVGLIQNRLMEPDRALEQLDIAYVMFDEMEKDDPGRRSSKMRSNCLTERGLSLRKLGRYDESVEAYTASMRLDRDAEREDDFMTNVYQVAMVHVVQGRQQQANDARSLYGQALSGFARVQEYAHGDDLALEARALHAAGSVYRLMGKDNYELAENALRKALAIKERLPHSSLAVTLEELGLLFFDQERFTESVPFFVRAIEYAGAPERTLGARIHAAMAFLRIPNGFDEARRYIQPLIPWLETSGSFHGKWEPWLVLRNIEKEADNEAAAGEAERRLIDCYMEYRRRGGACDPRLNSEVRGMDLRGLFQGINDAMQSGDTTEAEQLVRDYKKRRAGKGNDFADALLSIMNGNYEPAILKHPELHWVVLAEFVLLIEKVRAVRSGVNRPGFCGRSNL